MPFCGGALELHVAAERISVLGESANEWRPEWADIGHRCAGAEQAHTVDLGWRLGDRSARPPDRHTAEKDEKVASSHVVLPRGQNALKGGSKHSIPRDGGAGFWDGQMARAAYASQP